MYVWVCTWKVIFSVTDIQTCGFSPHLLKIGKLNGVSLLWWLWGHLGGWEVQLRSRSLTLKLRLVTTNSCSFSLDFPQTTTGSNSFIYFFSFCKEVLLNKCCCFAIDNLNLATPGKPCFVLPQKNDYWVSFVEKRVSGEMKPGGTCVFITPEPLFF